MKIDEVRALSPEDVDGAIDDQREELFKLRFRISVGQVTDTSRLKKTRRILSCLLTVRRENELAADYAESEAGKG